MKFNPLAALLFLLFFLSLQSDSFAGFGDETETPNPTGGFGQGSTGSTINSPNPVGGFGSGGSGDMPLGPPPPPGDPVPLDGGAGILIAAALGLGVKKLYGNIKNNKYAG